MRVRCPRGGVGGGGGGRENENGKKVKLHPPIGEELPPKGFDEGSSGFIAPAKDGTSVEIKVNPDSERLQLLSPFEKWDGKDFVDLPVLLNAKGK